MGRFGILQNVKPDHQRPTAFFIFGKYQNRGSGRLSAFIFDFHVQEPLA